MNCLWLYNRKCPDQIMAESREGILDFGEFCALDPPVRLCRRSRRQSPDGIGDSIGSAFEDILARLGFVIGVSVSQGATIEIEIPACLHSSHREVDLTRPRAACFEAE